MLCWVAKARAASGGEVGTTAAKEALAIYKEMDVESQLKALEALTVACKAPISCKMPWGWGL